MKLDKAKQELRSKEDAFQKLEETLHNLEAKAKGKDLLCRNQQEKLSELEGQTVSKTQLCRQLEKQLVQLSEGMKGKEEICWNLQQKVASQLNRVDFLYFQNESSNVWLPLAKVKELENKLKEREYAESIMLQNKVRAMKSVSLTQLRFK